MRPALPFTLIAPDHPDFPILDALAADILQRAGGQDALAQKIPVMLRGCIDDVIMTPKTGRRAYEELEKTEKTYIGTRVEIELRALLALPRGRLDTRLLGHDVDIKHTMGNNWMIPAEAVGHPCLLVAADEARACCYLGLIVAQPDYLSQGQNRDGKRTLSAEGFAHVLWLLKDHPYPRNFWRGRDAGLVDRIFQGASGNARMATLFREIQGEPIPREVVQAVAKQHDFMRRIRADKGRGTRDLLGREGIVLLSGQYDSPLIAALDLPACDASAFISHSIRSADEQHLAEAHGITVALC